jgi:hypothetical protein
MVPKVFICCAVSMTVYDRPARAAWLPAKNPSIGVVQPLLHVAPDAPTLPEKPDPMMERLRPHTV